MQTLEKEYINFTHLHLAEIKVIIPSDTIGSIDILDDGSIIVHHTHTEILTRYKGSYVLEYEWINKS